MGVRSVTQKSSIVGSGTPGSSSTSGSSLPTGASAGGSSGRRAMAVRTAAAAAVVLAASLLLLSSAYAQQAAPPGGAGSGAVSAAAAAGSRQLVLVPTRTEIEGHEVYWQLPAGTPRGLVILLHKCLPESISKLKQALARGYALAALSSLDRSTGGGGRCWKWGDDARAVAQAVGELPGALGLRKGAPVYVGGASSGGSIALRLAQLVKFDGVWGEVIAPTGMAGLLPRMRGRFPPAVYIHMPLDAGMAEKVAENVAAIRAAGVPVAEIKVDPRPLRRYFFSDRSTAISPPLSALLYDKLKQIELLDARDFIAVEPKNVVWNAFQSYLNEELPAALNKLKPQQAEQDARVVTAHIWECISLAWAQHETVGEYMTAVLAWMEQKGRGDMASLARRLRVARPSTLAVPLPARPRRQRR